MINIQFAYNSTNSIPTAGAQNKTVSCKWAFDNATEIEKIDGQLLNKTNYEIVLGERRILEFIIGRQTLLTEISFFRSFFKAKYRWAVYGNFKDTSLTDNLCACQTDTTEVRVTADSMKYKLISLKIF
jgi:hypothetical protein